MKKPSNKAFLIPIGFAVVFGIIFIICIATVVNMSLSLEAVTESNSYTYEAEVDDQLMLFYNPADLDYNEPDLENTGSTLHFNGTTLMVSGNDYSIVTFDEADVSMSVTVNNNEGFASIVFLEEGTYVVSLEGPDTIYVNPLSTSSMMFSIFGAVLSGLVGFLGVLISTIIIIVRRNKYNRLNLHYQNTGMNTSSQVSYTQAKEMEQKKQDTNNDEYDF